MSDDPRASTDNGHNMLCACGGPTFVVDCRGSSDGACRRRRHCKKCGQRFTTYERRADANPAPPNESLRVLLKELEESAGRVRKMMGEVQS